VTKEASLLRRKIEAARSTPDPDGISPGRALALAIPRASLDSFRLVMRVANLAEDRAEPADIAAELGEGALLLLLARDAGDPGLAVFDPPLLAALIEAETTGRLTPARTGAAPAGPPRRPTRTDAAIVTEFVAAFLAEMSVLLPPGSSGTGFGECEFFDGNRPIDFVLAPVPHAALRIVVDLGVGTGRQGGLSLYLPLPRPREARSPDTRTAPAEGAGDWERRLEAATMAAPADLTAVLWRLSMPLDRVLSLAPGSTIPIPAEALGSVSVRGLDGRTAMMGRLGQLRGHRAVRLTAVGAAGQADAAGTAAGPTDAQGTDTGAGQGADESTGVRSSNPMPMQIAGLAL
jgi:flagellar motor switch protein FliM